MRRKGGAMQKDLGSLCLNRTLRLIFSLIVTCATPSSGFSKACFEKKPETKPVVVGFAGWTLPMTSYRGSAVEEIIDRLRERNLSAEVYPPDDWPEVADRLATRGPSDAPIVLLGFSMGAAAAIHVAQKLGSVGIPVSKIVTVEAWNPEPVPANVAAATHFYSTRFAGLIRPAPGNEGVVENIDLNGRIPGIEDASHVAMSKMVDVQNLIIDKIDIAKFDSDSKNSASLQVKKSNDCLIDRNNSVIKNRIR